MKEFTTNDFKSQIIRWSGLHVDPLAAAEAAKTEAHEMAPLLTDSTFSVPPLRDFLDAVEKHREERPEPASQLDAALGEECRAARILDGVKRGIADLKKMNQENQSHGWEYRDAAYESVMAVLQNEEAIA